MKKAATKEDIKNRGDVQASIQQRAYLIAESEGFPHGRDIIHWLQAEEEILAKHLKEMSGMVRDAVVRATGKGAVKSTGNGKAAPAAKPKAAKASAKKVAAPKATGAKPAAKKAAKPAPKKS